MKDRGTIIGIALTLGLILLLAWVSAARSVRAIATEDFAVTKFEDSNDGLCDADCSLREAIIAANAAPGPDTVVLSVGTYSLTIATADEDAAATGDLDITDDLTLVGGGPSATVIDATGLSDRVLDVLSSTVVMSGILVQGGQADDRGGGILNTGGNLTLENIAISHNHAGDESGASGGAGVYNQGMMTMTRVTVSDNEAPYGDGGGVHNEGILTLNDSTVGSNGTGPGWGRGGGLYNAGTLTINNSTVEQNGTWESSGGGGVYNSGKLTLSGSIIRENKNSGFFGPGGGLSNFGVMTVTNATISDNHADSPGGGIDNQGIGRLDGSTINANSAALGGGGISNSGTLTITNTTISANTVHKDIPSTVDGGGGILNEGVLSLNFTTIAGNAADIETAAGGGIRNHGSAAFGSTIIAGNTAAGEGADCSSAGALVSLGHNLVGDDTGCPAAGTDQIVAPGDTFLSVIGALGYHGGDTQTHPLLPGSPAIDVGDDAVCPSTDQRGYRRPLDGDDDGSPHCDIGAYELFFVRAIFFLPILINE